MSAPVPERPVATADPQPAEPPSLVDQLLIQAFARLDRVALGCAVGLLSGLTVFLATVVLLIKGGSEVGPTLALLGQFFPGYTVSAAGSLIGLAYGLLLGFLVGWLIAFLHNVVVKLYLFFVHFKSDLSELPHYIDPDHR